MSSEQNFTDSSMQDAQQIKQGASNAMNIGRKASEMKKKYDAAKKAKEASGTAKTAAAAVGKAASGNVAGAAVEVAKSKEGKAVMILALIPVFLVVLTSVLFLYALPTMIFEGVQNYAEEVEESYNETVASSSSQTVGKVKAFFTTGGKLVTDFFSGIADRITGTFDENDTFTEADVKVTYEESSETATLKAKRKACTDKINQRITVVADDIRSDLNKSTINSYFLSRFKKEYGSGYVYDDAEVSVMTYPLPERYANEILSFYTVQTGGNVTDIKVSELLYWLGQKKDNTVLKFKLGEQVNVEVTGWKGNFLPQYLLEQKAADEFEHHGSTETDYEKYQFPAADLLVVVDSEDFSTMEPVITPVEKTHKNQDGEEVTTTEYHVQWVANIKIGCRNPYVLRDMGGLWDGALNEEQKLDRLKKMENGMGSFSSFNNFLMGGDMSGAMGGNFVVTGELSWPLPGYTRVSSPFGYRICPNHGRELHNGLDIPTGRKPGVPAHAAGNGVVFATGTGSGRRQSTRSHNGPVVFARDGSFGNYVVIDHGNGTYTLYGHLASVGVNVGQVVNAGDIIGIVGETGGAHGIHLHFTIMQGAPRLSNAINPKGIVY